MSERSFSQGSRTAVVAHRGAPDVCPENTLQAFEAAIAAGADAVEFDVRMTSDGVAVVMHDADVSRTTDGRGLVRALTVVEVKRLGIDLGEEGTAEVPTLEEVLVSMSGRIGVDIEIKNVPGEPDFEPDGEVAVAATVTALDRVGFAGPVLISSFNPFSIARAREISPQIDTGLLTDPTVEAEVALGFARDQGHSWILPHVGRVLAGGESVAARAHAAGLSIGTWLVAEPEIAVRLMRAGIDAIATNDPKSIVAALESARG